MFSFFSFLKSLSLFIFSGFSRWHSGKEPVCQCRRCKRHGFDPWVRKISWNRKWQPTTVFLPGRFHGQRGLTDHSPWGGKESDMTEHVGARVHTRTHTHTHTHTHTLSTRPTPHPPHPLCIPFSKYLFSPGLIFFGPICLYGSTCLKIRHLAALYVWASST